MTDDLEGAIRRDLQAELVPYDAERAQAMIDIATRSAPHVRRVNPAVVSAAAAVLVVGAGAALVTGGHGAAPRPAPVQAGAVTSSTPAEPPQPAPPVCSPTDNVRTCLARLGVKSGTCAKLEYTSLTHTSVTALPKGALWIVVSSGGPHPVFRLVPVCGRNAATK